jgi:hypothetical protein
MATLAIALYSVFLLTAPFEHHDLACHLKTPFHCTSCVSSPLSINSHTPVAPATVRLADAGRAIASDAPIESALLGELFSGRSPPQHG